MDRRTFTRTMHILESRYPRMDWTRGMMPFEILISTVLSQSTTVANERRGLQGLRERIGEITPGRLAKATPEEVVAAIWHAGLARQKAPRIRGIAVALLQAGDGRLEDVLALPLDTARRELMALPGVGPKTADVVLAMAGGRPTFPVDTHIARIAKRWDLAHGRSYESIRAALERWTPTEKRKGWHLALIAHGRTLCKARNPRCEECPVRRDCDWYRRNRGGGRRVRPAARTSPTKG